MTSVITRDPNQMIVDLIRGTLRLNNLPAAMGASPSSPTPTDASKISILKVIPANTSLYVNPGVIWDRETDVGPDPVIGTWAGGAPEGIEGFGVIDEGYHRSDWIVYADNGAGANTIIYLIGTPAPLNAAPVKPTLGGDMVPLALIHVDGPFAYGTDTFTEEMVLDRRPFFHTHPDTGEIIPSDAASDQAFGDTADAGVSEQYARGDHKHGMPDDPVPAHEAAPDPHPQYQKESEKDQPNGYAGLDAQGKVPLAELPAMTTSQRYRARVYALVPGGFADLCDQTGQPVEVLAYLED